MFSDSIFFSEARANYHRMPNQNFVYCPWLQLKRCHCTVKLKLNWCIVSEELLFIVLVPPGFRSCLVILIGDSLKAYYWIEKNISLILYSAFLFQIGYQKQFYHKIIPDTIEINENMVDKPFTILMTRDRLHNVVISIITVNFYKSVS